MTTALHVWKKPNDDHEHGDAYQLIASQLFPENPEAGKLIAATITFFIASTSSIMLISLFCAGAYALPLMFLFNNKTNLHMNGVGSVTNVKIWNSLSFII
ncbi:unnamed protein product, partial [Vitis vinifera]